VPRRSVDTIVDGDDAAVLHPDVGAAQGCTGAVGDKSSRDGQIEHVVSSDQSANQLP
jgi:hypothetical protein